MKLDNKWQNDSFLPVQTDSTPIPSRFGGKSPRSTTLIGRPPEQLTRYIKRKHVKIKQETTSSHQPQRPYKMKEKEKVKVTFKEPKPTVQLKSTYIPPPVVEPLPPPEVDPEPIPMPGTQIMIYSAVEMKPSNERDETEEEYEERINREEERLNKEYLDKKYDRKY
jgi:hypothetical protein